MPKRTSPVDPTPVRVVIITLDNHLASTAARASKKLARDLPGLTLSLHAATNWKDDQDSLDRCRDDIANGDIIIATMLFMEEHINPVLPALQARRDACDAMIVGMSAGEVIRLTRIGRFSMDGSQSGAIELLKRLRGNRKSNKSSSSGHGQMAMLRRLPKLLRFIPGTAQDVRAYFLFLQYWLAGSEDNVRNMVRFLVDRYAAGPRQHLRGALPADPPADYPDNGVYHPSLPGRMSGNAADLPAAPRGSRGTVGLVLMRSYVLAGNTAHYDAAIGAFEARGLRVIPIFACGLDARPAAERFWFAGDRPLVDAVVSLTGFSLVGGPAYNDAGAAKDLLSRLDVPYVAAHAIEFQTIEQWQASARGLLPVESTIMVAIPELEGATGPMVFGGRSEMATASNTDMRPHPERIETLVARVDRLVALRQRPRADRKVAVVLFNFPPNAGNTGTAAHLAVFESLHQLLRSLAAEGYSVDVPPSVDALRERITSGNAERFGTHANVHARIPVDDHVRRERWLGQIEAQWGPAPGRQQSDGGSLFVLGAEFGNVFVGVQPSMGYEGDPMRLLFEAGFAPTHAFSAFYRYLREDFAADVALHFGTHGALEFMPGKQAGMTEACWPDRLIGDLPNLYLYAANNPSEGVIAKRRAAATLISYLTPPVTHAGLYRELLDIKASLERWRGLTPDATAERDRLAPLIHTQAAELDLAAAEPVWTSADGAAIDALWAAVIELETTLIPHGLHVVGAGMSAEERIDMLTAIAEDTDGPALTRDTVAGLVAGETPEALARGYPRAQSDAVVAALRNLANIDQLLAEDHEIPALLRALDGRYVPPVPGGDLLRTREILPTGRNIFAFDPFRIPSKFAMAEGTRQATQLLDRHLAENREFPETIAVVLWGTDNLKTEGSPIAQALALIGAEPRFDSFGRLAGAALIPLEELGRPRVDAIMTLSGIFRDLLPLQTRLLAEAAYLAASADEPVERNFVRKHTLAHAEAHGFDLETAALRVFSNADGAYGSNVNMMIDNGRWEDENELGDMYAKRKCFAYGRGGQPVRQAELLTSILGTVKLAYQNLDSTELGVTAIDHYFDTLGGISRAVGKANGAPVPVYISDQTRSDGKVRTLAEQVALETRTRALNPRWYEGMLKHGYEGVQQIESQITNTMGWSATTGQVEPWVYQQLTETYVLDENLRNRIAALNPTASAKVAHRLLEAQERRYWSPEPDVLEALRRAGDELEDRLEGIDPVMAA